MELEAMPSISGWFQRLPDELVTDREPLGLNETSSPKANKGVVTQLRAATVLIDGRGSYPLGSDERGAIEELVDSIVSRDSEALAEAKSILQRIREDDGYRLERFSAATRIPLRIVRELSGGPPAGRTGRLRQDSQIRDDMIISLYAEWRRLANVRLS
jgi:hypothetical protein